MFDPLDVVLEDVSRPQKAPREGCPPPWGPHIGIICSLIRKGMREGAFLTQADHFHGLLDLEAYIYRVGKPGNADKMHGLFGDLFEGFCKFG